MLLRLLVVAIAPAGSSGIAYYGVNQLFEQIGNVNQLPPEVARLVSGHQRLKVIDEVRPVQARDAEVRLAKLPLREQ